MPRLPSISPLSYSPRRAVTGSPISILTLTGQSIYDGIIQNGNLEIDLIDFQDAMYLFRPGNQVFRMYKG